MGKESYNKSFSEYIEIGVKILTVITAASLIFGFMIEGIYLGRYGFWDFSLLKIGYIAAGLLFSIFTSLAIATLIERPKFVFSIEEYRIRKSGKFSKGEKNFWGTASYILVFAINFLTFLSLVNPRNNPEFWLYLVGDFLFVGSIAVLLHVVRKVKSSHDKNDEHPQSWKQLTDRWFHLIMIMYIPGFIILTISSFALFIYPLISRFWGGGRPADVKLTLGTMAQFSSPLEAQLLYQTQDFVLIDVSSSVYLMKQNQINNMQYLEVGSILGNALNGKK